MIDDDIGAFACFCRCLRGDLLVFCLWLELSGDPGSNDQPITGVCVACIGTQSRWGNRVRVFPGPRSVPASIQSAITYHKPDMSAGLLVHVCSSAPILGELSGDPGPNVPQITGGEPV